MKTIIVILFIALSHFVNAQTQPGDSLYIVTYTTGSAWDVSKKPNEQLYFKEHSANLSSLRKSGVIQFGARYAEKGIIIIKAATFQKAKEIIDADASVINKLFNAEVQKLNVFYDGCVSK